jgi:hypothetical protein
MENKKKQRVKFCWECGKQLYQRKICVEKFIDGYLRTLHKSCAKELEEEKENQNEDCTIPWEL